MRSSLPHIDAHGPIIPILQILNDRESGTRALPKRFRVTTASLRMPTAGLSANGRAVYFRQLKLR